MKPVFSILAALVFTSCAVVDTTTPVSYSNPALWQRPALTWGIDYTGTTLDPAQADMEAQACFDEWAAAGVFTFTQAPYAVADIKVSFTTLATVGHAAYPWQAERGIIRLDGSQPWGTGLALLSHSLRDWLPHEIGHALGLKHTLDGSAMREYGPYGAPTPRDLIRLRELYAPGRRVLTWKHYDT